VDAGKGHVKGSLEGLSSTFTRIPDWPCSLEALPDLYEEAKEDAFAIGFFDPDVPTGSSFTRKGLTKSQRVGVMLFDIEWLVSDISPALCAPLHVHRTFLLRSLGLPSNIATFLTPSSSFGIANYGDESKVRKEYRFHLWIALQEKAAWKEIGEIVTASPLNGFVDLSIFNPGQPILVAPPLLLEGVERLAERPEGLLTEGEGLALSSLKSVAIPPESEPFREAKRQRKELKKGKAIEVSGESKSHALETLINAYGRIGGNELYRPIHAEVARLGSGKNVIQEIFDFGEWKERGLSDLESKERWALEKCQEEAELFLWTEFNPERTIYDHPESEAVSAFLEKGLEEGILVCSWSEGSGKTDKLLKKIEASAPEDAKMAYVCHLIAPCAQFSNENSKWSNYGQIGKEEGLSERERKLRFCPQEQRLAICLPSIYAIKDVHYDILILDEIQHMLMTCLSTATPYYYLGDENKKDRQRLFGHLINLCINAKLIVALDASVDSVTGWFFNEIVKLRNKPTHRTHLAHDFDWMRTKKNLSFHTEEQLIAEIGEAWDGTPIVIHTDFSDDFGSQGKIARLLPRICGVKPEQIFTIDGHTASREGSLQHAFKSNPNEVFPELLEKGYRVFILSPVVGIGFSYTGTEIQRVYGIFRNALLTARDIKQNLCRIRRAKSINFFVTTGGGASDDYNYRMMLKRAREEAVEASELHNLWLEGSKRFDVLYALLNNGSRNSFLNELKRNCIEFSFVQKNYLESKAKEISGILKDDDFTEIQKRWKGKFSEDFIQISEEGTEWDIGSKKLAMKLWNSDNQNQILQYQIFMMKALEEEGFTENEQVKWTNWIFVKLSSLLDSGANVGQFWNWYHKSKRKSCGGVILVSHWNAHERVINENRKEIHKSLYWKNRVDPPGLITLLKRFCEFHALALTLREPLPLPYEGKTRIGKKTLAKRIGKELKKSNIYKHLRITRPEIFEQVLEIIQRKVEEGRKLTEDEESLFKNQTYEVTLTKWSVRPAALEINFPDRFFKSFSDSFIGLPKNVEKNLQGAFSDE
jgi:hypothetical protein